MCVPETDYLLQLARRGNTDARQQLLSRHRDRLRRMIVIYFDPRLQARVDPSDVIQDSLIYAADRLSDYLEKPPVDFYPWLRQIVRDQLSRIHRQHIETQCRSVSREQVLGNDITDASALQLADRLIGTQTSPSQMVSDKERQEQMRSAMHELLPNERELLLMRFVEQLSIREISEILEIAEESIKSRLRRAIQKLSRLMGKQT
jgi:RNA polymerase sigma-70 factor (ECF subfamily)